MKRKIAKYTVRIWRIYCFYVLKGNFLQPSDLSFSFQYDFLYILSTMTNIILNTSLMISSRPSNDGTETDPGPGMDNKYKFLRLSCESRECSGNAVSCKAESDFFSLHRSPLDGGNNLQFSNLMAFRKLTSNGNLHYFRP